jgi:hypothetical protein
MKATLAGSRLTQVLVEVLPKSTLRMVLPPTLVGLKEFIGVAAAGRFIGMAAALMGLAAEGWSVMKAPLSKVIMLILHKGELQKILDWIKCN